MGIAGVGNVDTKSYYINSNTGQLTTNLATATFRGTKEELEALNKCYALGGNMYAGSEITQMQNSLKNGMFQKLGIGSNTTLDKGENSIDLGFGKQFTLTNGKKLTLNSAGFEVSGGNPYDQEASQKASDIAGALNVLMRYSTSQISENALLFSSGSQKEQWTKDVLEGLSYLGIDTSKDFTINGTKFTVNNGVIESKEYSEAQAAYEVQKAQNRTYMYADEKTKVRIDYQSRYYLRNTLDEVKQAWNKALEETDFNPFSNEFPNSLIQVSTEQDFTTGGNDDIFGNTVESAIEAGQKLLDRANNPLGEVNVEYNSKEREFYENFMDNLSQLS